MKASALHAFRSELCLSPMRFHDLPIQEPSKPAMRFGEFPVLVHFDCNSDVYLLIGVTESLIILRSSFKREILNGSRNSLVEMDCVDCADCADFVDCSGCVVSCVISAGIDR